MDGRYRVELGPSRALCGLHAVEFAEVLVRLAPLVEPLRARRLARSGRKRAPGAGGKPKAFAFRLLVALAHLRLGTSLRETGAVFAIDEKSVRNYRDEIEVLLVEHGVVVAGRDEPVRNLSELQDHLRHVAQLPEHYVIVDGTETQRARPGGWDAQRPAWSSKSHRHVVKASVVTDPEGRPLWFEANPNGEGRTHDITMLRSVSGLLAALAVAGLVVVADLGYLGLDADLDGDVYTPRRRRPHKAHLDRDDKLYNHAVAQARIRVEHGIGHLKNWAALRRWRRHPGRYDRTGKAVTALLSVRRA